MAENVSFSSRIVERAIGIVITVAFSCGAFYAGMETAKKEILANAEAIKINKEEIRVNRDEYQKDKLELTEKVTTIQSDVAYIKESMKEYIAEQKEINRALFRRFNRE